MNDKITAAVADTQARVLEYLKNPTQGRMFGHLLVVLGFVGGGFVDGLPVSRVLDRALQALRKGGKIRCVKQQWELAPKE